MIEQVIHIIDSLSVGGAQKLLVTFGMEAKKRGLQTRVVSLQPPVENQVSAELKALGVQLDYFPAKGLLNLTRIWRLRRYLQKQKRRLFKPISCTPISLAGWLRFWQKRHSSQRYILPQMINDFQNSKFCWKIGCCVPLQAALWASVP